MYTSKCTADTVLNFDSDLKIFRYSILAGALVTRGFTLLKSNWYNSKILIGDRYLNRLINAGNLLATVFISPVNF